MKRKRWGALGKIFDSTKKSAAFIPNVEDVKPAKFLLNFYSFIEQ